MSALEDVYAYAKKMYTGMYGNHEISTHTVSHKPAHLGPGETGTDSKGTPLVGASTEDEIADIANALLSSKKPLVIAGGGVRYSEAGRTLEAFCEKHNIPFAETQNGKSAVLSSHKLNLGGVGVTGNLSANLIAKDADLVIGVGTRFSDFTTASKSLFKADAKFATINTDRFDAYKLGAIKAVCDAKLGINALDEIIGDYKTAYSSEISDAKAAWADEIKKLSDYRYSEEFEPIIKARYEETIPEFVEKIGGVITQTSALALIRKTIDDDAIAVAAAGSLPGCMQRMWTTDAPNSYNMEYGYSCMGYEIAGALGSKMAEPDKEVYAFCGDGSYLMLHSELVTSIQENQKINVLLFDTCVQDIDCISVILRRISNKRSNCNIQIRNIIIISCKKDRNEDCRT